MLDTIYNEHRWFFYEQYKGTAHPVRAIHNKIFSMAIIIADRTHKHSDSSLLLSTLFYHTATFLSTKKEQTLCSALLSHNSIIVLQLSPIGSPNIEVTPRNFKRVGYLTAVCLVASVAPEVNIIVISNTVKVSFAIHCTKNSLLYSSGNV